MTVARAGKEARGAWRELAQGRAARLDGLRALAILSVFLYHLGRYDQPHGAAAEALLTFVASGWAGVDLFFVLSGFLITGILLRQREAPGRFRTFYARRFLRIFPLYYALLLLFLVVLPRLTPQAEHFWMEGASRETFWYWTYLSNLQAAFTGRYHHHFLEITWTLAIEEQFYLCWPLVVWSCSRRTLIRICGGILAGAFLLRAGIVCFTALPPLFTYNFTLTRIDTLAAGALVAALAQEEAGVAWLGRAARVVLPVAGLGYLALLLGLRIALVLRGVGAAQLGMAPALAFTVSPLLQTVGYSLLALGFAALLVHTLSARAGGAWVRFLQLAPVVRVGRYSYGLYLLHVLGAEIARNSFEPARYQGSFLVAQGFFWLLSFVVSYGLAAASWHLLEAPCLRLARYFPYRAASARAGA